jgi:TIR domain
MAEVSQTEHGIIFINYRRTDAGWPADHLASKLESIFGKDRVFLDVRGIDAGDDFASDLEEKLRRATILLVLVGKGWLYAQDKYGRRRLDTKDDWVRAEIRRGLKLCIVIPVLIDDAELPDEEEALPNDIRGLLKRQRIRIRQANSDDDIEALSTELEKAGLRRLPDSGEAFSDQNFSDKEVLDVVGSLRQLQQRQGVELVGRRELLRELDRLFNRKTFRFEALRNCPEQRWADRLDSAYQTEKVLRSWERNVREVAEDKYRIYVDLVKEVGSYSMQMGVLLFDPAVDYNSIAEHIGKTSFKAHLPPEIRFPVGSDKQPRIPDEINNPIERHRKRAVTLMNKFAKEDSPSATEKQSLESVDAILKGCFRRAVYTRTHAQLNHEAMFDSIKECRELVQSKVPGISDSRLTQRAADLISAFEGIERERDKKPWDFSRIDSYKLEALKRLTLLSRLTGIPYPIPTNLTEENFFSKTEADLAPTVSLPQ